jgi:hypothetical protein
MKAGRKTLQQCREALQKAKPTESFMRSKNSRISDKLDLSRFLRQTVKAQNSLNGENLSHGIVS